MDQGAPFQPIWNSKYAAQKAGSRNKKSKKQKGGLCLKSLNMDQGAPFHPIWNRKYAQQK